MDTLRRIQKTVQKTYEYNLGSSSAFNKDLNELIVKTTGMGAVPPTNESQAELLKTVESALSKMRGLKRKLSDLSTQSTSATKVTATRLSHLAAAPESIEAPAYPAWARRRLSYHLTDYFLRASPPLKLSAKALAKEEGIEDLVDSEIWEELVKAENGLRARRLEEVLSWVGENRVALKKAKVSLRFLENLVGHAGSFGGQASSRGVLTSKSCVANAVCSRVQYPPSRVYRTVPS